MSATPLDRPQRLLVTGSSGFVGAALCERLVARGHRVVGLDERPGTFRGPFVQHDLTRPLATAEARERIGAIDACLHLASTVGGFLMNVERADIVDRDRAITESVIALCRDLECRRLLFTSSINVFEISPTFDHAPLSRLDQRSPYAASKALTEARLAEALPHLVVVRPTNLYGRAQGRRHGRIGESHVIPDLLDKIDRGGDGELEVLGDGSQVRNFLHVDDMVDFLAGGALSIEGRAWLNLRSDLQLTIAELARQLLAFRGVERRLRFRPEYQRFELFRIGPFDLGPARARGFRPAIHRLDEGLRR